MIEIYYTDPARRTNMMKSNESTALSRTPVATKNFEIIIKITFSYLVYAIIKNKMSSLAITPSTT